VSIATTAAIVVVGGVLFVAKEGSDMPHVLAFSAIFSTILGVGLAVFAGSTRALGGRAGALSAWIVLLWAFPLATGAQYALGYIPIVDVSGFSFGVGAPEAGMVTMVLPVVVPLFTAALGFLPARSLARGDLTTHAAPLALLAIGILVGGAAVRAMRAPDPDTFKSRIEARPPDLVVRGGESFVLGDAALLYRPRFPDPNVRSAPDGPWDKAACDLLDARGEKLLTGFECLDLRVWRVDSKALPFWLVRGGTSVDTLAGQPLRRTTLYAWMVHDIVAPPIGWIVGAALGLSIAVASWLAGRHLRRRAAGELGVDGHWTGYGDVDIEGRRMPATGGTGAPGPVRVAISAPEGGYRAAAIPQARILGRGTVAEAREELLTRARSASLAAIVTALVASAPLVTAAMDRLVF
jgi:hypothetical protein